MAGSIRHVRLDEPSPATELVASRPAPRPTPMPLRYTPLVWPFVASFLVTLALGVLGYRRRHVAAAPTFALLMASLSVWTLCYAAELVSATLEAKQFWATAKYLGSATAPVIWFVLALRLARHERWLTPLLQLVLAGFAVGTCFVVFTNPVHHAFWRRVWLEPGYPETQTEHGPFFWIYAAGIYTLVVSSAILLFRYYRRTPPTYRRQAALIALGALVPLAGRFLEDVFRIDLFPRVDNVVLLFLISGVLWGIAVLRYGALDLSHIAHDLVVRTIRAGIVVVDTRRRVVEMNPYALALTGAGEHIGEPLERVMAGWPPLALETAEEQEVAATVNGASRWFHLQSSPLVLSNGVAAGWALVLIDVTAREQAEEQLAELARLDPLTGAANRRSFFEAAEVELARARRHARPQAVVMLDIDHFKSVNDSHGHLTGDELLRRVAAECRAQLRATDLFARYGGEEFVCLLDGTDAEGAMQTAERMRAAVESGVVLVSEGRRVRATISAGVAVADPGEPLTAVLARADRALYASKEAGRNRVTAGAA